MSGERKAVDESVTDAWVQDILKSKITSYHPKDVFNVDESGLFWKLLPEKTLAFKTEKCFGGNKSKERLTFLVSTNMDGTEKLPVFAIGHSKNPKMFQGHEIATSETRHQCKSMDDSRALRRMAHRL